MEKSSGYTGSMYFIRELPGCTQEVTLAPLQAFLRKQHIAAFHASFLPPCLLSAVPMKNVSLNFRMDPGFEQQGHHRGVLPMLL